MNFSRYYSLQKTVCLDLKNSTKEDLFSWLSLNKTSEKTSLDIEQIIKNNIDARYESAKIERVYLQGDLVMAKAFENYDMKVEICDLFMEELKKIPLIENETAKKHISLFMHNFIKNSRWEMSESRFMDLIQYQEKTNNSDFSFLNQTIAFDISNYNLRLKEILNPKRFKPVYCELKRQYPNIKILRNFIVQKMYYYNRVPVAFSAKLLSTNCEEQWFWSDQFAESLLYLEPTLLVVPESDLSLNPILDKINEYGLPYLTTNEINLLEKNK